MRLEYTKMPQIIQNIADSLPNGLERKSRRFFPAWIHSKQPSFLVSINNRRAVPGSGNNTAGKCSALRKLHQNGIRTIIAETSSLFGYYALNEMILQRHKHPFSLLAIQVEGGRCH